MMASIRYYFCLPHTVEKKRITNNRQLRPSAPFHANNNPPAAPPREDVLLYVCDEKIDRRSLVPLEPEAVYFQFGRIHVFVKEVYSSI